MLLGHLEKIVVQVYVMQGIEIEALKLENQLTLREGLFWASFPYTWRHKNEFPCRTVGCVNLARLYAMNVQTSKLGCLRQCVL